MINLQDTKLALRNTLISSSIIDRCDMAYEGIEFDPKEKSLWLRESILEIDQRNITRCLSNFEGIYILGIFMNKKSNADDINKFAMKLDDIFNPINQYMSYGEVDVFCHYTSLGNLMNDEQWNYRNFSVYFRSTNQSQ